MRAIIMVGVMMSGKSTWVKNNRQNETVINCDNIRMELTGAKYKFDAFIPENEKTVWKIFYDKIKQASINSEDIIIDNTNCNLSKLTLLREQLFNLGYGVKMKFIDTDIEIIKKRLINYPHLIPIAERMNKNFIEVEESI